MTVEKQNEEERLQGFHLQQRRALNNAYGSIVGEQNVQTFSAFTFEDAVDLQIERIEGAGTQIRPNLLARVDKIEQELVRAVEELKKIPPSDFLEQDPDNDANTEENPA